MRGERTERAKHLARASGVKRAVHRPSSAPEGVSKSVISDTSTGISTDLLDVAYRQHDLHKVAAPNMLRAVADSR